MVSMIIRETASDRTSVMFTKTCLSTAGRINDATSVAQLQAAMQTFLPSRESRIPS